MIDANDPLTSEESEFAAHHYGVFRRGDTWYRLHGWGTRDDWNTHPLVRVPDDHAEIIIGVDPATGKDKSVTHVHSDDIDVLSRIADCYHPTTPAFHSLRRILRAIER